MGSEMWMMSPTERDHDVTVTMPGKAESLRASISEAIVRLDYKVTAEQPLSARRSARGCARMDCSFESLDYPRKLTISLKQINEVTTIATFNYEIKAYTSLTRGDRQTLDCEARAITALATQRASTITCSACGTTVTDDSRFCRRCGALVVVEVAELEVLRLMENSRRGYHKVTLGAVMAMIALLLPLLLIWIDTAKAIRAITLLSAISGLLGLVTVLHGLWQLHRALNPVGRDTTTEIPPEFLAASKTSRLPPRSPYLYVTEGTTELLEADEPMRDRVAVQRKAVDTAEVQ